MSNRSTPRASPIGRARTPVAVKDSHGLKQVQKPTTGLARVRRRPDPEAWGMDELMTLQEAAELCWPEGPLTVTSLRTAVRDRQLAVAVVAGKFLTTRRQLAKMATCHLLGTAEKPVVAAKDRHSMSTGEARALLDSELERLRDPRNPQGR